MVFALIGVTLAMGYAFYYVVERQRLPDSDPESDWSRLLPDGSDEKARARMEQEAYVESMFADISNEDKQRIYRRYRGTHAPRDVAPLPAGVDLTPNRLEVERPRVRRITVVRKKGDEDH